MERATAIDLMLQHVKTDILRRHLVSVEAAMQAYAREYNGDSNWWGISFW